MIRLFFFTGTIQNNIYQFDTEEIPVIMNELIMLLFLIIILMYLLLVLQMISEYGMLRIDKNYLKYKFEIQNFGQLPL
ncbi:unnamed protein product [Paramecium pentaurelia]|uniref:Uncharacterized protein n=1 Tax=Paramecium pentaurelia TaxID=43138 RepID=A0A8S1WUY3_9CILI|nr:unnamed protein product [Paramecium pentaurelia]